MADSGSGALERVRATRLAEAAALERGWDVARLPARRSEEPIEAAIDRLSPTFMEVAMTDAMTFAMKGSSLPVESAASALGARSRVEMRLFVADWILRADLHDPGLREQDAPLADRHRMFEAVCRRAFSEKPLVARRGSRKSRGLAITILLGVLLALVAIYVRSACSFGT